MKTMKNRNIIVIVFSLVFLAGFLISNTNNVSAVFEYCGDNICNNGETQYSCSVDCGNPPPQQYCGDNICNNGETQYSCPTDCGSPPPTCSWSSWSSCSVSCDGGTQSRTNGCGTTQTQSCNTQSCGECNNGDTQSQSCGINVGACSSGTQSRTCSSNAWGGWGSCGGSYIPPVTEVCDGVDNDCDGSIDEGGVCSATAPVISGIPDQTLFFNSGFNNNIIDLWSYTTDPDTALSALTFTITAQTNTSEVNCVIDSNRYIDCTAQNNRLGNSDVTVQVSDGTSTDTDTFNVGITSGTKTKTAGINCLHKSDVDLIDCFDDYFENLYLSQFLSSAVIDDLGEETEKGVSEGNKLLENSLLWLLVILGVLLITGLIVLSNK